MVNSNLLPLFPSSRLVDLLFSTESLFQIDLETVRQVQEVAEYIGEFFFQGDIAWSCMLFIQPGRLAHRFREFADFFDEEHKLFRRAIFGPAAFLTDQCEIG